MAAGTRDTVLVLRLWVESHDERVRARLLSGSSGEGVVAIGVEEILAAVEAELRRFAATQHDAT